MGFPTPCFCCDSEFLGHIVAGDLNIVRNQRLRDLLCKCPKYREPVWFSWHQNFNIIMDACEEYARRWAKKEDVFLSGLSRSPIFWNVELDDFSTSPPKNHAVLYIRAIYRISQISIFYAWSASFDVLNQKTSLKVSIWLVLPWEAGYLATAIFRPNFAMFHIWQTLYFEGIKMLLNFNIYRNWLLFSIHLK